MGNSWFKRSAGLIALMASTGCFHQVVQTGRRPSTTVVQKSWVSTWIFGLVEAKPIDTRSQCPSGVATIETMTSVPNGLLTVLTLGIWDPQTAKITCASGMATLPRGMEVFHVGMEATSSQFGDALQLAVKRSAELGRPVALQVDSIHTGE